MKLKDFFLNGKNLFGEQVIQPATSFYCDECGHFITGKVHLFFELTFCSDECKHDYEYKLG